MKEIALTTGETCRVSDEDFEFLSQWDWRLDCDGYVRRDVYQGQREGKNIYRVFRMHRVILERIGHDMRNMLGDHRDGNPQNNTRENLRPATHAQNCRNQRLSKHSKLGLKGVVFHKRDKKYQAAIRAGGGKIHLGYFKTAEEAHAAYCAAAVKYHGEFSNTGA